MGTRTASGEKPGLSRRWRMVLVAMAAIIIGEFLVIIAVADPLGIKPDTNSALPLSTPAPAATTTRPQWQFAPSSNEPLPGAQQCPDAGSVGAGSADAKTEVFRIEGKQSAPVRLLGPNRRVVVAKGAVMTGSVTLCGDGGTVLVAGTLKGPVLMRGSGVKIVIQDGGREKLPPAYFTTNGAVFRCTTATPDANTPHCDDYVPRPGAKPNG